MKALVILFASVFVVSAQRYVNEYPDQPIPYSFQYVAPGDEGQSSHQETGDGQGRVQGSYSLQDIDGRSRIVEYVADEGGFRATIRTNEPGTANQNPADVVIESTADQGQVPVGPAQPRPQYRAPQAYRVPQTYRVPAATRVVSRPQPQAGYVLVPSDRGYGGYGGYGGYY